MSVRASVIVSENVRVSVRVSIGVTVTVSVSVRSVSPLEKSRGLLPGNPQVVRLGQLKLEVQGYLAPP